MSESSWLISAWKAKVSVSEAMAPPAAEAPGTQARAESTRVEGRERGWPRVRALERGKRGEEEE